jgi:sulfatase modifying factor 1
MIVRHFLLVVGLLGFAGGAAAGETFKDCSECPLMVKVSPGTFMMGSSSSETTREAVPDHFVTWEQPQHSVTIRSEFALGRYSVTRGEFAAFVQETSYNPATGCNVWDAKAGQWWWGFDQNGSWLNPGFAQTDQHPVVCVSFEDAQRYVQWLSTKTRKPYRLPTEAEWEYAARASTTTARFWGDGRDPACDFANVADFTTAEALNLKKGPNRIFQCRDGYVYTAPVGSFRPNPFGLYDMLGNVWQWMDDCFHESYSVAPSDGSGWTSPECKQRVSRGGSWADLGRQFHHVCIQVDDESDMPAHQPHFKTSFFDGGLTKRIAYRVQQH